MSRIKNLCDEKNKNNTANSTLLAQPSYQGCFYLSQEFKNNVTKMLPGNIFLIQWFFIRKICVSILLL